MTSNYTMGALAEQWQEAKEAERDARALANLHAEHMISLAGELPDSGTTHFDNVKIVTAVTRSWDQAKLAAMQAEIDPAYWPFKSTLTEDRKMMKLLEERFPDLAAKLEDALSTKPKKAALSVSESDS